MHEQGCDPFGVVTSLKRGGAAVDSKCRQTMEQMDAIGKQMDNIYSGQFQQFKEAVSDSVETYVENVPKKKTAQKTARDAAETYLNKLRAETKGKEKTVKDHGLSL